MNPLYTYIESQLKLGTTREVITSQLLGQGWNRGDIDRAFISLEVPLTPATPASPATATPSAVQTTPVQPQTIQQQPAQQNAQPKKSSSSSVTMIVILIIVLILIGAGAYLYLTFFTRPVTINIPVDSNATTSTTETSPVVATAPVVTTKPVTTTVSTPAPVVKKTTTTGSATQSVPVITLRGQAKVVITQGDTYTDAGATAYDATDGTISDSIVTTGLPIDTTKPGTYTVSYTATDSVGLSATKVSRIVSVLAPAYTKFGYKATIFPSITVNISKPQPYSVVTPDNYSDSDWQPRAGYQYMISTVTYDNQSSMDMPELNKYLDTNDTDFHVVDATGKGYGVSQTLVNNSSATPGALTGQHLLAYTKETGTVVFEIPTSMPTTSDLKVVYQWSEDQTVKATFGN